jgi:hypothetical protein
VSKLQALHGEEVITEAIYENQCETKQGKPHYKKCAIGFSLTTYDGFVDDILCEKFISNGTLSADGANVPTARKEVVNMAVKMKRIGGNNVSLVRDLTTLKNTYTDVGEEVDSVPWISPVVATALRYNIITKNRDIFEPERSITRAEAFAVIMKSVCMMPIIENRSADWQRNVYNAANKNGMTIRDWSQFTPNSPILSHELVTIASRASEWAERTGGCHPKPEYCFLEE